VDVELPPAWQETVDALSSRIGREHQPLVLRTARQLAAEQARAEVAVEDAARRTKQQVARISTTALLLPVAVALVLIVFERGAAVRLFTAPSLVLVPVLVLAAAGALWLRTIGRPPFSALPGRRPAYERRLENGSELVDALYRASMHAAIGASPLQALDRSTPTDPDNAARQLLDDLRLGDVAVEDASEAPAPAWLLRLLGRDPEVPWTFDTLQEAADRLNQERRATAAGWPGQARVAALVPILVCLVPAAVLLALAVPGRSTVTDLTTIVVGIGVLAAAWLGGPSADPVSTAAAQAAQTTRAAWSTVTGAVTGLKVRRDTGGVALPRQGRRPLPDAGTAPPPREAEPTQAQHELEIARPPEVQEAAPPGEPQPAPPVEPQPAPPGEPEPSPPADEPETTLPAAESEAAPRAEPPEPAQLADELADAASLPADLGAWVPMGRTVSSLSVDESQIAFFPSDELETELPPDEQEAAPQPVEPEAPVPEEAETVPPLDEPGSGREVEAITSSLDAQVVPMPADEPDLLPSSEEIEASPTAPETDLHQAEPEIVAWADEPEPPWQPDEPEPPWQPDEPEPPWQPDEPEPPWQPEAPEPIVPPDGPEPVLPPGEPEPLLPPDEPEPDPQEPDLLAPPAGSEPETAMPLAELADAAPPAPPREARGAHSPSSVDSVHHDLAAERLATKRAISAAIDAARLEGRMAIIGLAWLPVGALLVRQFLRPGALASLVTTVGGVLVLLIAMGLTVAGLWWLVSISRPPFSALPRRSATTPSDIDDLTDVLEEAWSLAADGMDVPDALDLAAPQDDRHPGRVLVQVLSRKGAAAPATVGEVPAWLVFGLRREAATVETLRAAVSRIHRERRAAAERWPSDVRRAAVLPFVLCILPAAALLVATAF
jgi:hypothetical protein